MADVFHIDGEGRLQTREGAAQAPASLCLYRGGRLYPVSISLTDDPALDSSTTAASAKALKTAWDKTLALEAALGEINLQGAAPLTDRVDLDSPTHAASAKAVKTAFDKAEEKVAKAGDTMSGPLRLFGKNVMLRLDSDSMEIGAPPESPIWNGLDCHDKNGQRMGGMLMRQGADGALYNMIHAVARNAQGQDVNSQIIAWSTPEGRTWASGPAPREDAYAHDLDTLLASANRHPIKLKNHKNFYVGGANASDTANLFQGRGDSPEMPFASLEGAMKFIAANYASAEARATLKVCADLEIPNTLYLNAGGNNIVSIESLDLASPRRLGIYGSLILTGGIFNISGLILESTSNLATGRALMLQCYHSAAAAGCVLNSVEIRRGGGAIVQVLGSNAWLRLNDKNRFVSTSAGTAGIQALVGGVAYASPGFTTSFEGAFGTVCEAVYGGFIHLEGNLEGSPTGRRYNAATGGKIITVGRGPNFIPGSIEGTCDSSSVYA